MLGLSLIWVILFVLVFVILLIIEAAFWVIVIGGLGAVALFLWATGLHEAAMSLVLAIGIIWSGGWAIYRLIKWDLNRIGAPAKAQERSLAWRIHDLLNGYFLTRLSRTPKVEAPPVDPEERFLWANRLGRYVDTNAGEDASNTRSDQ